MRRLVRDFAWVGVLALAVACEDPLTVENENQPDVERALSSPASIEQLISTTYQQINQGLHGSSTALDPQMAVMSFESYGSVANFGMNVRAALPRTPLSNERNNQVEGGNLRDFSHMSRRSREAANGVAALDRLIAGGGTLGTPGQDNRGRNRRARGFGLFSNGVALGNLALAYDSAAIVTHQTPSDEIPPLSGYADVMTAALRQLDSAQAVAAHADAAAGFPLPNTWLAGNAYSQADFVRLIRSYKARFRAGVARTPTERAAVDWNAVIADAAAGITGDFVLTLSSGAGWNSLFKTRQIYQDDSRGWHNMPMMIYGMADTSGEYSNWIATPIANRTRFLIRTPDRRFPAGNTRAEQQANSPANAAFNPFGYPYIRNRTGQDTPGAPFGESFYDFYRWKTIDLATGAGPWVTMAKAEMDMLRAEGHIRANQIPQAVALIDVHRTRAGLTPLAGAVASATDPVPGGAACVPRVPTSAGNTTTCGNVMEAMKWEKRMETAYTGYGQWYFDARGWGDLPEGTGLHWPVPYQELDARQKPIYSLGGIGGTASAAKGTYGF